MNDMKDLEVTGVEQRLPTAMEKAAVMGDLSSLTPLERLEYYRGVCESVGLNPLTKPFMYIRLNNQLTLYARKDATDQLRAIRGISITSVDRDESDPQFCTYIVQGRDKHGRTDMDIGSVPIGNLKGEARSNATMKALTKAKRRLTLSLAGLGLLDESEVESVQGAEMVRVDMGTGEIQEAEATEENPAVAVIRERMESTQEAPAEAGYGVEAAEEGEGDNPPTPTDAEAPGPPSGAKEPCGHLPDPNPLGIEVACEKPKGHKAGHKSSGGTWPR